MSFDHARHYPVEPAETLRQLAREYQSGAGEAYAAGRDGQAAAFRDTANTLLSVAETLPRLYPKPTGPVPRGHQE